MPIPLTQDMIHSILNKPELKNGLEKYLSIQQQIIDNPYSNPEFRTLFDDFYKMNIRFPSAEFYEHFYHFMPRIKSEKMDFKTALAQFRVLTQNMEATLISAAVATFQTDKPIWNNGVLEKLELNPKKAKTIAEKDEIYQKLCNEIAQFLKTDDGAYLIEQFDKIFPYAQHITPEKKVDLVLWQFK